MMSTKHLQIGENHGPRRGAALVAVLVCLILVSMYATHMLRSAVQQNRQDRAMWQQCQSMWLAEAAIERGVAQLQQSADYRGETWDVSAEQLSSQRAGRATIQVHRPEESSADGTIEVLVDYPSDSRHRQRYRKQVSLSGSFWRDPS